MRGHALLGLIGILLLLAGCAPRGGEPGVRAAAGNHGEDGIGGTGAAPIRPDPDPRDEGVGGTGVFGTVTGLGSILVNGLRVEIPESLAARPLIAGSPGGDAGVGHTVAATVEAVGGTVTARDLVNVFPLVGPIGAPPPAGAGLTVMGTPVVLDAGTVIIDGRTGSPLARGELGPGDRVAVSGLWRFGTVLASRLERVGPEAGDVAAGLLRRAGGRWRIGGTAVDLDCCEAGAGGSFTAVAGRYRDGVLVANRLERGAGRLFAGDVQRLVVEAFLARNPDGEGYHLSGFGIPLDPDSRIPATTGSRSLFAGRLMRNLLVERDVTDRSFLIERALPLPEAAQERRRALERWGRPELPSAPP